MRSLLWFALVSVLLYGSGRAYFWVTGGFTEGNITQPLPYDVRWEIAPLHAADEAELTMILNQKFHYLGKGCQSYVFQSENGEYVIKFLKYQRFRTQPWEDFFSFIPFVDTYRRNKVEVKKRKLENLFTSWKIAYDSLRDETGLAYIHLNKSRNLGKTLVIYDKMGLEHRLNSDDYEFLIQRKATLLCTTLDKMMAEGKADDAKRLLDNLHALILSEYARGLADNDHALMQNTGVLDGRPIHIDVGQFVRNDRVKDPLVYKPELFNKMWKFRKWLEAHHPTLFTHLNELLNRSIGEREMAAMRPHLEKSSRIIISNQE